MDSARSVIRNLLDMAKRDAKDVYVKYYEPPQPQDENGVVGPLYRGVSYEGDPFQFTHEDTSEVSEGGEYIFFSSSPLVAQAYAGVGGRVFTVNLHTKKVYPIEHGEKWSMPPRPELEAEGYDSVYWEWQEGFESTFGWKRVYSERSADVWLAFDPKQIEVLNVERIDKIDESTRSIIRRLLTEAAATKGDPRTVRLRSLYAWGPKVSETLDELKRSELSYHEEGAALLVSKLSRRGAWFVLDGHHRAIEAIQRGDSTILIQQSADVPNIEHGGGYRDMLSKMVNIADAVAEYEETTCPDCECFIDGQWRTGHCDDCGGEGRTEGDEWCANCLGTGSPVCCRCSGTGKDPLDRFDLKNPREAKIDQTRHAIRKLLTEADEPYITADVHNTVAIIHMFSVPREQRGQGLGRATYEEWEAGLPGRIKLVKLWAADTGPGPSDEFWMKMGFSYTYDRETYDREIDQWMWKGINGADTPDAVNPYEDDEEEQQFRDEHTPRVD